MPGISWAPFYFANWLRLEATQCQGSRPDAAGYWLLIGIQRGHRVRPLPRGAPFSLSLQRNERRTTEDERLVLLRVQGLL